MPDTELGTVTVTAQRPVEVEAGSALGSRTVLETPFSIGTANTEQIARIAATTIDAAVSYDASIRSENSGQASGNTFVVRGQRVDLTFGYKYDGLPFPYWYQDQPIESLSEIQILKGAGGFVYGYASPSGVVNFVPKKPTKELKATFNLSLRSSSVFRAHVDIGGPVREGSSIAFRLNAVHEEGTLYNGAYNRNQFATLWLQGNVTPKLTWSADGFYQRTWQQRQSNNISLAAGVTKLKPVDWALNLGAPATTKWNDVLQGTGRLNYQITPDWKASAAVRYTVLDERFPGNGVRIENNEGDYSLSLLNQNRIFYYYVGQITVDGKFKTGPVEHRVVGGFDYLDINYDYDYQPYTERGRPTSTFNFKLTGNIYDGYNAVPDWGDNPAALEFQRPPDWFRYEETRSRAFFVSDTLRFGNAELLAGLRYTIYKDSFKEPVIEDLQYKENSLTPVAALSYDILEGARVYASYVEALQRGGVAPAGASNVGESFGPLRSTQWEIGAKAQQRHWNGSISAYRTIVPSEYTTQPAPGEELGRFVRDGERRFQGIEAHGEVEPTPEWLVKLSAAYLHAKQTKAGDPAVVGKWVPDTTAFQATGLVQYEPDYVPGLRVFGGVRYSGRAWAQALNTFVFDPVAVGDAGIGYSATVGKNALDVQANVQNITNERYWVPTLSLGAPRTFSVNVGLTTGAEDSNSSAVAPTSPEKLGPWYIALDAGAVKFGPTDFDVRARVQPVDGVIRDGLLVKHSVGWELGGALGYDLGLFRGEFEVTHKQASLSQVKYFDAQVPIDVSGRGAGTYDNPGGSTGVLALAFNALFDLGGDEQTPWGVQAGVGLGLARINSSRWELEDSPTRPNDSARPSFQNDNASQLAWQGLAAVKRRLSDRFDVMLKYRLFNVPSLNLFTTNANEIEGTLTSHSFQLGTSINL